ncbi:head-tail connector protein [Pseudomonas aeruginosa]|uniref:head-tail connector protein n=1 Tax=Pseudomonas aeruginosa TaxID=287 RepID=UPI0005A7FE71|nr:head-tail connector protein [Pseudomonas aeruginosa]QMX84180.1 phage gp6-like head-tail connector protein [Pseudomonas aeruginosa]RPP76721.1 phage gp6-like head-tail connector protein [Pseudomonas aeruginosa]UEG09926.1 phage gp6-like head-tail connector protein [Pseudomonas aeruginosa]HCD9749533.1 phage gp6-like head-tail connector protein [Pseudomonas aeruginosa]HCE3961817.1 phage gp6-like head-tail connector protein [Pseudomonas aeruginosa]
MSLIPLDTAKSFLDVIHDWDDAKLQLLLDGAEDEACQFMWRQSLDGLCNCDESSEAVSSEPGLPPSVVIGVLLLLQASYQAAPEEIATLRKAAEVKLMPYRCGLGV